jgi:predicted nucleotidyltransferase
MKNEVILDSIVGVIRGVKEPEKIVLFGSRASGDASETSDIDIAIFGKDWTDKDLNGARHLLEEEVQTPLKFDLINFYAVSNLRLKKNIETTGRVLYESGKD